MFKNWITWYKKDGFSASSKRYVNNQESILFMTRSNNYIFNANDIRMPYLSSDRMKHATQKGILKNGKRRFPNENGKLCTDVWEITSQRNKAKLNGKTRKIPHRTPKPNELMARMVMARSNPNDLVLDLFSSLGIMALACLQLNRQFIGCKINQTYYEHIQSSILQMAEIAVQ